MSSAERNDYSQEKKIFPKIFFDDDQDPVYSRTVVGT